MVHKYGAFVAAAKYNGQPLLANEHYQAENAWQPSEPDETATIWRYMSLAKFCSMLSRKALFFSLIGDMEDKYEGFIYPLVSPEEGNHLWRIEYSGYVIVREFARTALVSCWTESGYESSLMWEHYAGEEGVAICTTFQNLKDSIRTDGELPIAFGQVEYVDYNDREVSRLGTAPLFHKRMEYREEGEVRAILPGPHWDPERDIRYQGNMPVAHIPLDPDVAEQRGRYIPVDLEVLVREVVLPPNSKPWFAEVVESVIRNSSISPRIMRSAIESPPHTWSKESTGPTHD